MIDCLVVEAAMRAVRDGALAGAVIFLLSAQLAATVVVAVLPADVARASYGALALSTAALYLVTGAAVGGLLGGLLAAVGGPDGFGRRVARVALPHLALAPLIAAAAAVGDRDVLHWALVGGVATLTSLAGLLGRRRWLAVLWLGAGALTAAPWFLLGPAPSTPRPGLAAAAGDGAPRPPDLALIVLDTVRLDRLALYGDAGAVGAVATPALAALAADGVRFDRAYAASPWSAPSHASLFTGLVPSRHGTTADTLTLDGDQPVLAELLRRAGYATAGFSGNPWVSDATGLARGFHHWHDSGGEAVVASHFLLRKPLERLAGRADKGGRDSVAALRGWLADVDPARPRFVFVNLSEPHAPYWQIPASARRAGGANRGVDHRASLHVLEAQHHGVVPPPGTAARALPGYDAAIAYTDALLGELVAALDAAGAGRAQWVVVLADHGEAFGDDGVWGHAHTLQSSLLHVPLVIRPPAGTAPDGARVRTAVSLVDVAPTLLDAAGLPAGELDPIGGSPDGRSLRPLVAGADSPAFHPHGVFAEHAEPGYLIAALELAGRDDEARQLRVRRRVVIRPPWRIEAEARRGEPFQALPPERTPALDDPAPAADDDPAASMHGALRWWLDRAGDPRVAPSGAPAELPEGTRERLRALGYLD